jgi:hypothetical protein
MPGSFTQTYPNIARWLEVGGWIEIGADEYSVSLVRALDRGGLVWESKPEHKTVDEALVALEAELGERFKQRQ